MLNLPQPDHTPLRSPALPLVVAQARYAGVRAEVTAEIVSAVQARLRDAVGVELNRVAPLVSTDIIIGPGVAPPPQVSKHGMQLSVEDGQWQATVTQEWVSLETPSFRSYAEDFEPVWTALLAAVSEALSPVTVMRAGLRFVNVLKPPVELAAGAPAVSSWDRWVRGSLAGPAGDDWLRAGVLAYAQQMLIEVGPAMRSGVRTGPLENEDRPAFLLDIDTFSEPQAVWADDEVVALFEQLNGCGVALFQGLVTPEMLNYLRGGDAAGGGVRGKDQ